MTSVNFPQPNKLKTEDSVMIKDHTAGPFDYTCRRWQKSDGTHHRC